MIEITTLSELTIDGKLALGPGASSKELFAYSSDELKRWFHEQRASCDAIMVGAGTVRTDDPELTVRHVEGRSPLRVIPSSDARLPLGSRVLNDGHPTLVVTSRSASPGSVQALRAQPAVEVICCGASRVDLAELMLRLEERGVRRLIVEGGSTLLRSLFEAELVSRIIIKHIPILCGRSDAPVFLESGPTRGSISLSKWRVHDWFVKGGIGVSIYARGGAPTA
jgi:riboflavin-specific deaminase-like protein